MEKLILKDIESINVVLELALKNIDTPEQFNYTLDVDSNFAIYIKLYGNKFNDSITGQVARGLWEFQQEIYRAVAYTLYGQASIKKLTKEDLEKYNLTFHINEGSTEIKAFIQGFFNCLAEALKDMSSAHKALLIAAIASIVTYGYVTHSLESQKIDSNTATSLKKIEADLEEIKLKEHTKHLQLMAEAKKEAETLGVWKESVKEGVKSVAKALDENDSMDFGEYHLPPLAIQQLKQKSPKVTSDESTITDNFTLYGFKEISPSQIQFEIRGASGEYTVLMDSDTFSKEEMNYLTHIAADIDSLKLTIKLITIRDKVKVAYIADFNKKKKRHLKFQSRK